MTDLVAMLDAFQFLRPIWLAIIPVMSVLWWRIRRRATARSVPATGIAPHLAAALTVGGGDRRRILPIDGVALAVILTGLAAAGPSWSYVPNPLLSQTAPLAVVLKTSESMASTDIAPSRLERAKQKIRDLIAGRSGGRTALIAYAGTAHRVVPLTEDPAVLAPFVAGLSPDVMPAPGGNATAALEIARDVLAGEPVPGGILFVLDTLDPADLPAFADNERAGGPPVVFLLVNPDAAAREAVEAVPGATVVRLTPDGSDVAEIERRVASAYREALARDDRQRRDDRGWLLALPAMLLTLLWFRRGWTMRWAAPAAVALFVVLPGPARAEGVIDWFLTADQQGRLAFDDKDYAAAADRFADPMWRGYALYRNGDYAEAAEVFASQPTAEAAFAQGMAHVKAQAYRDGIRAFEVALERNPEHAAATRNLQITRAIVDYVERVREQSDTGEEAGIGADDIVFDNESGRGAETTISGEDAGMQTAEEWMRTVDTRTSDFLRIRFALEAAEPAP